MDLEDLEPRKKTPKPRNLEEMSIEALHEYIEELAAEIERVKAAIKTKEQARSLADSVFRK